MNDRIKGIITPVGSAIGLFVMSIGVAVIYANLASDSWAALGTLMMTIFVSGLLLLALLIYGIVSLIKKQSEYGKGIVIGIGGMIALGVILSIGIAVYNAFVA